MRTLILSLFVGISMYYSVAQNVITVKPYYRYKYIFESGYWVYHDTLSNQTDSVVLESIFHNYISPNPVFYSFQEYFTMNYYSHFTNEHFNHYIITEYWKYNGGGEWGQLGQPLMYIQQFGSSPVVGSFFNGCEVLEILPALEVDGTIYQDVIHSHIFKDLQYQHDFQYDVDFYMAPFVGVIRKVFSDSLGVHEVWDLQQHHAVLYTGIEDNLRPAGLKLYPVPAETFVHIALPGLTSIEVLDIQGTVILSKTVVGQEIDLDVGSLSSGSYILRLLTPSGSFFHKLPIM